MNFEDNRNGFTLIELMIVVAIIAIIAAIAIPTLTASRIAANEASAISSLRVLHSVNEQHRSRYGAYATSLAILEAAGYIDSALGSGTKSGYDFNLTGSAVQWSCSSTPITAGGTGNRSFFIDTTGVVRFSTSGVADGTSPPID
ncbi:MAG: prepilin-type N-terminal cleavage/methylation domain-containing protein [Planctomycetota bacterium]